MQIKSLSNIKHRFITGLHLKNLNAFIYLIFLEWRVLNVTLKRNIYILLVVLKFNLLMQVALLLKLLKLLLTKTF